MVKSEQREKKKYEKRYKHESSKREGEKSVQVKAWKLHGKCPLDGKRIEKLIADFMHELGAVKFNCIGHR